MTVDGPQLAGAIMAVAGAAAAAVVAWQVATILRARFAGERDDAYRKLAEEFSTAQRQSAESLAEVRSRLEAIERLLREVG